MTERVERRVARALLRLVAQAGRRVDTGVAIDFTISRQNLASGSLGRFWRSPTTCR